jgi:trk system potassium uptake protein
VKVFGPDLVEEALLPAPRSLIRRLGGVQIFVLSFVGLILIGTAGLLLLPGLYAGPRLGLVDALFMATSAVCVTGLIVVDTATYFTPLGQAWILALIQAGGLGIVTFTTLIFAVLGRRRSLRLEEAAGGQTTVLKRFESVHLIRAIVLVTLSLEAVGAAFLWLLWQGEMGGMGALWPAIFHSVSAFCNAGFSIFSDSLMGFRESPLTLLAIGSLVVLGGLGFIVLEDLRAALIARRGYRIAVHTRLVLATTGVLLLGAWLLFTAFEWTHQLEGLTVTERLANAFYMSVTPRTAGFNTVDYAEVSNASLFVTIVLMVIGGSPGSMAGGIKTVSLAVLVLLLAARLRGDRHVHAFHRTIPPGTVARAASLAIGGIAILGSAVFLLLVTETALDPAEDRGRFVRLVFEAHSAFGTVGLSMGATPELSVAGRLIVTALMFLGRVGPAAVVAAMFTAGVRRRARYRFGEEDVNLA